MFYKLIEKKRDEWFSSPFCPVRDFIGYIIEKGQMRDAQLEAIKTYLYLKIACQNQPLWKLFVSGTFNGMSFDDVCLTDEARYVLTNNPAAAALFEYSRLLDRDGNQLAPALERLIKEHPSEINYEDAFRHLFYGVNYTDYLFSLPMGAGKTFLMAAFIYIDLYFAFNEPDNPCFAHNFMIFAPSGLKSSIVPSLKHIMEFNPTWIVPNPMALQLKRTIQFEILDEQKAANKSNFTRNPNAQKLNNHQPLEDLVGLVAITNAEKVILDRLDEHTVSAPITQAEKERIEQANELRSIIGHIPNLAIYIDEVHHAAEGDIKLRQVVEEWSQGNTFNAVLGFSGTPYLPKAEQVKIGDTFSIKNTDLTNVVSYYPLIKGINNFLKDPVVMYADASPEMIIDKGVKEFLSRYKDKIYTNGTCAKLAIYCGSIENLEEMVYPQVFDIVNSFGMDASQVILKYHGGNKTYPRPTGVDLQFAALDTDLSEVRIVLLVQIGKEGWDCKSLTGVILPQKGVCPTNMVLQTSCRCLRQVSRREKETALIWLNQTNADTLGQQLKQQQNITLHELNTKRVEAIHIVHCYDRTERLQVPMLHFNQLHIGQKTQSSVDKKTNVAMRLKDDSLLCWRETSLIFQGNMEGKKVKVFETIAHTEEDIEEIDFNDWLFLIARESMGTLTYTQLLPYTQQLLAIFKQITKETEGEIVLNGEYDQQQIRSNIRQAFWQHRTLKTVEETIACQVPLLKPSILTPEVSTTHTSLYYPEQTVCEQIVMDGLYKNTYHYLPYHFNNEIEKTFFKETLLQLDVIKQLGLEVYYNGDKKLSGFSIDCYRHYDGQWKPIGPLYPTFLILKRTADGKEIDQTLMISMQQDEPIDCEEFIKTDFVARNTDDNGYKHFELLYLENSLTNSEREMETQEAIQHFFIH